MIRRPTQGVAKSDHRKPRQSDANDPPVRLAHILFVLWVAGSVAWMLFAAMIANDQNWLLQRADLAALVVLAPPILTHILMSLVIRLYGNPKIWRP